MTAGPQVCIFAGGTGGHVYPALAVADRLRDEGWAVSWVGTRRGIEARVVEAAGVPLHFIAARGLRGGLRRAHSLAAMAVALVQSLGILLRLRPALVLGMGGYAAAPGGVAAWLLRRPLLIHEQNAVPGLANRLLARLAAGVMESFPGTFPRRGGGWPRTTGNPVRPGISALPAPAVRFADPGRSGGMRVLALGGSQGAESLNRALPAAAAAAAARAGAPLVIRHLAGEGWLEATRERYREAGVEADVAAFAEDMARAYAWADLVVCRAGASTVAELTAAGVGSVLVPYPWSMDDHQGANARYLEERGAARVVADGGDLAPRLAALLGELAADPPRRLAMAEAARAGGVRDAARRVVECCRELADGPGRRRGRAR